MTVKFTATYNWTDFIAVLLTLITVDYHMNMGINVSFNKLLHVFAIMMPKNYYSAK